MYCGIVSFCEIDLQVQDQIILGSTLITDMFIKKNIMYRIQKNYKVGENAQQTGYFSDLCLTWVQFLASKMVIRSPPKAIFKSKARSNP